MRWRFAAGPSEGRKPTSTCTTAGSHKTCADPDQLDNVDNTIEGYGSLNGVVTNESGGVIDAAGGGLGVSGTIANHGLMEACSNGGDLALSGAIANAGAAIEALDGSAVTIAGGSITGGVSWLWQALGRSILRAPRSMA